MLNRRALLLSSGAFAAFSASSLPASGQVMLRPSAPAPPGGLAFPITVTNPANGSSRSGTAFSFGLPLGRGDFFTASQKLAVYDSTGTTHITDCQVDQVCTGWSDGSVNHCAVSGYLTGQTLAPGVTGNYTVRAIPGTSSTTPVVTAAQVAAASDLKAVCKIAGQTYTCSFNTIRSLYSGTPGVNPQGHFKTWKSGPYLGEYSLGQYLKRDSDGASHMWIYFKVVISALSATGPFSMRGFVENIQSFTANPVGTIGINQNRGLAGIEVVDSVDFFNGTTRLWSQGGPLDTRAGTIAPSSVNLTTGEFLATFPAGTYPSYAPIGFYTTGSLPAGLGSAATATYWCAAGHTANTIVAFISRWWCGKYLNGSIVWIAKPAAGATVPLNRLLAANGGYWVATTAGVTTGSGPTGAGPTSTDGSVVWTLVTARVTSQGSGTHTVGAKLLTTRASKTPIMAADTFHFSTDPAGGHSRLLIGYDFNYLTTKTKSVPPLNPTIPCVPWVGALPVYSPNNVYMPGGGTFFYIGAEGGGVVDERINIFAPTAAASIYLPSDLGMTMSYRYVALSFLDREAYHFRDETSQQILATNYGPDRLGGTYPGLGASKPNVHYGASNNSNSISADSSPAQWPGYGGDFGSLSSPEVSHNPNPLYWPYLTTGDPLFLEALLEYAATIYCYPGSAFPQLKFLTLGGLNYAPASPLWMQTRATGHGFAIFAQVEWIVPDDHPAAPFFHDVMDDSATATLAWLKANMTPLAQSVGYVPFIFPTWGPPQYPVYEVWMHTYWQIPLTWEAWKGNRPGFKTFLETYYAKYWCNLFDSDFGGSEKFIDVQYTAQGTSPTTPNPDSSIPPDSQMLITPQAMIQAASAAYASPNPYPPTVNEFVTWTSQPLSAPKFYSPGATFPAGSFGSSTYMALTLGSMAGIAQYTKVLARVDALFTLSGTSFAYIATSTQVPNGNRNALMYAVKKS